MGYNANIISTLVDLAVLLKMRLGYNANIISTLVDEDDITWCKGGYNANIISTLVDIVRLYRGPTVAIMPTYVV